MNFCNYFQFSELEFYSMKKYFAKGKLAKRTRLNGFLISLGLFRVTVFNLPLPSDHTARLEVGSRAELKMQ